MSSQSDLGFVSLLVTPAAGISAWTAVSLQSDGSISPTSDGTRGYGVTQEAAIAGRYVNVKLWTAPGTWDIIVSPGLVVTPGNAYSISNGYAVGTGTTGATTPTLIAAQAGVSASGIVLQFAKN